MTEFAPPAIDSPLRTPNYERESNPLDSAPTNNSTSNQSGGFLAGAKSYLPQSVANYLPETGSTPSTTEHRGTDDSSTEPHESSGVSGSQPGVGGHAAETGGLADAKSYLPQTVSNYLPETGSTPNTTEHGGTDGSSTEPHEFSGVLGSQPGVGGHVGETGGVGELPGDRTEANVAVLPDERNDSFNSSTRPTATDQASFPAHETSTEPTALSGILGAQPGVGGRINEQGGVGNLPGDRTESSVALLPDERNPPTAVPDTSSPAAVHTTPSTTTTAAPAVAAAAAVTPSTTTTATSNSAPQTEPKNGPSSGFDGHGEGYHPADLQPATSTPPSAASTTYAPTESSQPSATATAAETLYKGAEHEHGKTGLVNKLKGEAKVIAGKVGKNPERVERGKALMGKD